MNPPPFRVTTRADMARLIGIMQQYAPWRVPLLEAAHDGAISLVDMVRDAPLPAGELKRTGRPNLVLVGDDDYQDTGPDGWACRARLAGWARYAVIHGTGGDVASYRAAVLLAIECQRLALIETGTKHGPAWHGVFRRAGVPTLNLVTREGGHHPVPLAPGEMH